MEFKFRSGIGWTGRWKTNLLQGVLGVGMWERSEDSEPKWSQDVRASTQPDSEPFIVIINSSSSSNPCPYYTWFCSQSLQIEIEGKGWKVQRKLFSFSLTREVEDEEPAALFAIGISE